MAVIDSKLICLPHWYDEKARILECDENDLKMVSMHMDKLEKAGYEFRVVIVGEKEFTFQYTKGG